MKEELYKNVDNYIENLFAVEDEALINTKKSIEDEQIPQISVSANQGKFLQLMALLCNAKRILEIGTLAGYSTIWLARSLPDDGKIITLEMDKRHADVAEKNIKNAGLSDKVEIKSGKAAEMLQKKIDENEAPFDMIFIDADKPPYTEYFELALKLSRPGTLIISDNVIRDGNILNENSSDEDVKGVQRFNKILSENKNVLATIIPTVGVKGYDGMAIAVVKE